MRALLSLALVVVAGAIAQETVFRGEVNEVRIDAQVVNGKDVIANLTRDDFLVYDEGVPQTIQYFGREAEPVWVVLLLDVSGSMALRLREMSAVAQDVLGVLGKDDQVAVMFFGRTSMVAQKFTQSAEDAAAVIGTSVRLQPVGSGTVINGAIRDAAQYMRETVGSQPGRRAVVILTDNKGLNYQVPNEDVLEALSEADTVLNGIVTPDAAPPKPPAPGVKLNPDFIPSDVFALADETGGEVLRMVRTQDTFREMLERIRSRYSLHYRAPIGKPGQLRHVRVELAGEAAHQYPRAVVRARSSYRLPE
jgi:Ca-activated chloride channel homolog